MHSPLGHRFGSTALAIAIAILVPGSPGASRQAGSAPRATAAPITLSIVGTNDLHGGVLPADGRGGLALLGGYVSNLRAARARDGGAVLLIDAGDMWQGTLESNLTEGAAVVAAYNGLGYAAAAIGNHEFDFGPEGPEASAVGPTDDPRGALKARATEARFPFLAANLIDTSKGRPVDWPNVKPSVVVDAAGGGVVIRVGIVGVMTAGAFTSTLAANTRGLVVAPLTGSIVTEARALRAAGASVIVVTAHAGGRCTRFQDPSDLSSCDPSAEIVRVARELPAGLVDMIIAGHTHAGMAHEVAGIPIVSSFSGGQSFGRVDLSVDRDTKRVVARHIFPPRDLCARENARTGACDRSGRAPIARYEGTPVVPDARTTQVLAPAVSRAAALKAAPLGVVLDTPVRRTGVVESPLGNLVTDALRASVAGADVVVFNTTGGLRADLPRGPLTYGAVYEMYPFDNRVVQINITGAELRRVLAREFQWTGTPVGISGIRVSAQCSGGTLVTTMTHASGNAIRDEEKLLMVTIDFLATGGDGILASIMPPGGFAVPDAAPLARDIVVESLRRRGGRLREDELIDREQPRWVYPGTRPVNCAR